MSPRPPTTGERCPHCGRPLRERTVLPGWDFPCASCGAMLARVEAGGSWRPPPRRPQDGREPRTLLWLGIGGLLLAGLPGPFAWYLANDYRRGCRRLGVRPPGTVTAGWILGMVATVELIAVGCAALAVLVPYLLLRG